MLSCTKSLSDQLQSVHIDMGKAADLAMATIDTFQEFRRDSAWEHLYKYVEEVGTLHHITISYRRQRQVRLPRRLEGGAVMEPTGVREVLTTSDQYKISLYFPILDAMLSELMYRFNDKNLQLMRAIQCCTQPSPHFLEPGSLLPLADCYSLDMNLLQMECSLAKRTLMEKDMDSVSDVVKEIAPLYSAFPTLVKLSAQHNVKDVYRH